MHFIIITNVRKYKGIFYLIALTILVLEYILQLLPPRRKTQTNTTTATKKCRVILLLSGKVKNVLFVVVQVTAHCEKGSDGCWKEVYNPQSGLCACCANAHVSLPGGGGVECKEITQESA